jgi:arylsulfatase A-like enzyme
MIDAPLAISGSRIPAETRASHAFHIPGHEARPNILLMTTDQQRFDTIRAAGYPHMHTPNLDRLAAQGCLYERAYSPNPICLAARHSLIAGCYANRHGMPDNGVGNGLPAALPTLPRILSDNGYDTRAIGKMHFIPARRHNGFLKMELMEELPPTREEDEYAMYLKDVGLGRIQNIHGVRNLLYMLPQRSLIPHEHHGTTWVGDRTIDYLQRNQGRQPFFLWASWIAPHPPFDIIDRFADLYQDADLPAPYFSETPLPALAQENAMLGDIPDGRYMRRMREVYYAAVSMVDEQVGRILDTLEETGQLDNTLIIFTSDHGEFLGDYGLYQKWLPYDSAARVPFIVRFPERVAPGSRATDFVDLLDILPTALDVAGVEYPGDNPLPGASLFREGGRDRSIQYLEYARHNRRWISLRNETHKYNYYYGGGVEQLFDMGSDPHETTNLLHGEPDAQALSARETLKSQLVAYERQHGLEGYVDGGDFKPADPYKPHPQRNEAFQRFLLQIMDPAERAQMNSLNEEILLATADEPVVRLRELDYRTWQRKFDVSEETMQQLLETDDHRHREQEKDALQ